MTQERRRQILEAAAGVIAERGTCDARIADVAERIGISPALILYYFPSKDALLAEAIAHRDREFFDEIAVEIEGVESAIERLELLIAASCPPAEGLQRDDNEWQLWLETWSRSRHVPELAAERSRMDELLRATIADIVELGINQGTMKHPDPAAFSVMLSSLIDGLAIQVLLQDPRVDTATMQSICLDVARRELAI